MKRQRFKLLADWTFESDDKLDLGGFADRLEGYLRVDHRFTSGTLVVSLEAPFGCGKTAFLSMWKKRLHAKRENNPDSPTPILLNAWEDDFCGEPLLSLISRFVSTVGDEGETAWTGNVAKLKQAAQTVAWFGLGLANSFVAQATGLNALEAGQLAQEKRDARDGGPPPDILKLFAYRQEALRQLKAELKAGADEANIRAIVIVDELDRCRPDYAISFLETIKHIFDVPGIVFVLAIDRMQISNSAKTLFGSDLDSGEYLRKFIARSFELPKLTERGVHEVVRQHLSAFMSFDEVRASGFDASSYGRNVAELCYDLRLTLRQIEEFFRILGHVFSTDKGNVQVRSSWTLGFLLLSALKVKNDSMYRCIGFGKLESKSLLTFLLELMSASRAEFWGCLYFTGKGEGSDGVNYSNVLASVGQSRTPSFGGQGELEKRMHWEWGEDGADCINRIYEKIETAVTV